ncbi:fungal specific transcription factor domain-containing protein 71 [Elsinoe australis]|uniref:Fungal specific transcription factor domain-containing protein 71 n=1 Tax=Elsinoe australis TaxID=40998 RepID=A0A4U7AQQ4_9PEZI|nr:fungal specific transcription factor domain-containing protein 71 [Elsinoe australis]
MSSTVISTTLVDAYFSCYNTSNPVLDEPDFRRSLGRDSGNSRRDPYFGVQYQLVLAIGHWIIGGDESFHASFYHAARAQLSLQCLESGSLSLVQALLLIGNFLQKRDRPNTGYNYIGLAGRIAVGLGLHRETHNDVTQDRGRVQLRRRVLWILFYIESGFALTTGRPCLIDDDAIETPLPANLDDEDVVKVERNKTEVGRPTVCSAMIVQSKLAIIANRLQRDLFASKTVNSEGAAHSIKALEEQLLDWRVQIPAYFYSADVPEWFRGPRAIVMWKEQNLRMIFWRACKRNPNAYLSGEEASRRSYRTALENIREIANFCHDYDDLLHQNICWYATYCSFQAALVLILGQLEERHTASTNTEGTSLPLATGLS